MPQDLYGAVEEAVVLARHVEQPLGAGDRHSAAGHHHAVRQAGGARRHALGRRHGRPRRSGSWGAASHGP